MSNILKLYKMLEDNKARFIDEVFEKEIYKPTCPQLTIIDAGAYEGEFSFYSYPFAKKIYAIEPDPRPFEIMKTHVEEFEVGNIILPFNIALAKEDGERNFFNSGYGGSAFKSGADTIVVKTQSLANFMKENKIDQVDVLKIDVESAEREIFGAPDFPSVADKIKMIIGEHGDGLPEILLPLGFKLKDYQYGFIYTR